MKITDFLKGKIIGKLPLDDPRFSKPVNNGISRRAVLMALQQGKCEKGKK